MRKDKNQAIILRKEGKSYSELQALLGIPKSTLSNWLRDTDWSVKMKEQLTRQNNQHHSVRLKQLDAIRGKRLSQVYAQGKLEAGEEFEHFKYHPLFLISMGIYWGEGNKASNHNIVVGNTDPLMINIFVKFLKEICGVPTLKIRAYVLLYPDLDPVACKKFWIKNSGLSEENFNKSVVIKGRHKIRKVQYGVCNITVSSRYLKEKVLEWLRLLGQDLTNNYYMRV
jgi:hypothetical protein